MKKKCISSSWIFAEKVANNSYHKEPENKIEVDLPHDYAISRERNPKSAGGCGTGYYDGGYANYTKYIKFENKEHTILDIDGAYMCAGVRLNKDLLAMHPNGYMPLLVDLTDYIVWGKSNKLEIFTNDIHPSARWYSGAGLYRDVFLWTGGSVRIEPWDLYVVTNSADSLMASITVKAQIASDYDASATLVITITDKNGNTAARSTTQINVSEGRKTDVDIDFDIDNPLLWDTENPNLYTLKAQIIVNEEVTDTFEQIFGIREIRYIAGKGMTLNGKSIKLKGGCIHHDHGALGACSYPAAEERKVRNLKNAGFNSLRLAHNPQSTAFMEVCDREGILVMDEAFDMWVSAKRSNDYHLWFADWWARDISYMVKRDRSHPCIVSYSIGNEIHEAHGYSNGAEWSKKLADEVRKYDTSRPVTSAVCGSWETTDMLGDDAPEDYREVFMRGYTDLGNNPNDPDSEWDKRTYDFMKPLDIVGYNYAYGRYGIDCERYPERIIWGSETHAITFYDSWKAVMENPNVLGDFTWTAHDNIGETGAGRGEWDAYPDTPLVPLVLDEYPWRTCWQGDLELTGVRRPQSYFREAIWRENTEPKIFTTHPEHNGHTFSGTGWHWYDVCDTWTFDDKYIGEKVKTEVYTSADEIRFILNDKEVGTAKPEKGIASLEILYEKGELRSEAIKDGKVINTSTLKTVGKASKIVITPEKKEIVADGRDLAYFQINITDENGDRIPDAKNKLICSVSGGELLCVFSGDPKNEDRYTSPVCHAFGGRALAVVKTKEKGNVSITVSADLIASGSAVIKAV